MWAFGALWIPHDLSVARPPARPTRGAGALSRPPNSAFHPIALDHFLTEIRRAPYVRNRNNTDNRNNNLGFRVARTLSAGADAITVAPGVAKRPVHDEHGRSARAPDAAAPLVLGDAWAPTGAGRP